MRKLAALVWLLVIVVSAFGLYMVKYRVQALKTQIAQTEQQLEEEREALHVVAAEWAYLNRPERLQALSEKYLSSTGVTVEQIAEIEAISFPKKREASMEAQAGIQPVSARILDTGEMR